MIRFLFKGLFRDRQRSLLPVIIVASGVFLTVFLHSWLTGVMQDGIELNARFITGHMKIMTRAYSLDKDQLPNDLAITGSNELTDSLNSRFPEAGWYQRIRFGGLIDVSGSNGETRAQGPVFGIGIDLISGNREEIKRLNLETSVKSGHLPRKAGEILISNEFAHKLKVRVGDKVTLIGSTMNGAMAMYNFTIAGTVEFGTSSLDRGTILTDLIDAQAALDMEDACSEIVGYLKTGYYDDELASGIEDCFNELYSKEDDEFSPVMSRLSEDNQMAQLLAYSGKFSGIMIAVFILAMSVVLWNAGLLGGLRRYGEFGLRLAMGESKGQIYRSQFYESVMVGIIGTIAGTILGLAASWYVETYGINLGGIMKNATMMFPSTFHARITPAAFYIGFIPGLVSTVLGTMLSGIGIYKRKTSQLFKELEA